MVFQGREACGGIDVAEGSRLLQLFAYALGVQLGPDVELSGLLALGLLHSRPIYVGSELGQGAPLGNVRLHSFLLHTAPEVARLKARFLPQDLGGERAVHGLAVTVFEQAGFHLLLHATYVPYSSASGCRRASAFLNVS